MVEENFDTLINCLRHRGRFDVPPGTGTRLIVSAVGKKGFEEETNLCFVRNSKSEDSHLEINLAHFKDGLTEKLLSTI